MKVNDQNNTNLTRIIVEECNIFSEESNPVRCNISDMETKGKNILKNNVEQI